MALTNQEKALLREIICKNLRVTPKVLADMAAKTDDEVRALLASEKAAQIASLTASKAAIEAKIASLQ